MWVAAWARPKGCLVPSLSTLPPCVRSSLGTAWGVLGALLEHGAGLGRRK